MPLQDYGVLLGTKAGYHRDPPDAFGRFYHGHIDVLASGQLYNTAIDVDSRREGVSVRWRVIHLRVSEWQNIFSLPDGFHRLTSTPASGAVDYIRDPRLRNFILVPEYIPEWVPWWRRIWALRPRLATRPVALTSRPLMQFMSQRLRLVDATPPWKTGADLEALVDLEAMITDAARVVIFGEFYPASGGRPPGLHDIHLNQGDPPGSQWWNMNGVWQDGLTIAIHSDGTASAFMNMFSTQSLNTDDQGHPT